MNVNVLHTTSGMISEVQPDGSIVEREGRSYSAKSDIEIRSAYPLSIPHAFTLENDSKISFMTENEGWGPLTIPFNYETVKDATGKDLEIRIASDNDNEPDCNYIFTLAEGGDTLSSVESVEANVPALFHSAEKGVYTFSATTGKVPSTPTEIRVNGKDYSLHATYSQIELPADQTYLLNETATAFVPTGSDEETVNVRPFELYATAPAHLSEIPTELPYPNVSVGVDKLEKTVDVLTVTADGNRIVIYSPEERTETLYDIDGRALRSIRLSAGKNVIELDMTGVYVIANTKVKL